MRSDVKGREFEINRLWQLLHPIDSQQPAAEKAGAEGGSPRSQRCEGKPETAHPIPTADGSHSIPGDEAIDSSAPAAPLHGNCATPYYQLFTTAPLPAFELTIAQHAIHRWREEGSLAFEAESFETVAMAVDDLTCQLQALAAEVAGIKERTK